MGGQAIQLMINLFALSNDSHMRDKWQIRVRLPCHGVIVCMGSGSSIAIRFANYIADAPRVDS